MYMAGGQVACGNRSARGDVQGYSQLGPDHFPEVLMRRTSSMLASAAALILLGMHPTLVHAQSMDKAAKPAMGDMKDTSAMKHDGAMKGNDAMAKDGMSTDSMNEKGATMDKDAGTAKKQGDAKGKSAMKEKDAMAESGKMKQP